MLKLIIANKNYSSWSMRAWLYLRESNLQFEEVLLELFTDDWSKIRDHSPAAKAPVLIVNGTTKIWDSLAIIAFLQNTHTDAMKWPTDPDILAKAWSISAEMHSGFLGIRNQLPMNIRQSVKTPELENATQVQIARIDDMWTDCIKTYGGPWLFGEFSIADIMYIPVALRFVTYGIEVSQEAQRFIEAVLARDSVKEWIEDAKRETAALDFVDDLRPIDQTPLTPG